MLRAPQPTRLLTSLVVGLLTLAGIAADGATLFDPALKFRTIRTEHFRIYFHQGEDRLAARVAVIAEDTWRALEGPLGVRPPLLTHLVIADQSEQANGYATPLPYNTIVIYPSWPRSAEFNTDDWLRLVVTHEFTHIVHLDRSEGYAGVVRGILGRHPVAFPNLLLPTWQIEGLATYEESAVTSEGRLHAGDFRVVVDEAARQRALEPLDRVNGGLTDWPAGQAPYAYGARFHQYLAERFGAATLGELATATARRLPYVASPVFKRIFGESLGQLWKDYESSLIATTVPPALDAGITRLTKHGFVAAGPRFDRFGGGIVYSKRTAHEFPTLERIDVDGAHPRSLTTRYFGATTAFSRDAIVFDQLELERNVALHADLYRVDRRTQHVARLTNGQRLRDPDSTDDGRIVAVRENRGQRELVIATLDPVVVRVLVSEADAQFNAPRWSPDGKRVVAERHRVGCDPEIVVFQVTGGPADTPLVVASAADGRVVTPAWRPDGRAVVAAMARGDDVFNLYEFPLDGALPRQLTHTTMGAMWPDVSADAKTIVFVGYTTAGYDVFSMPYPIGTPARMPSIPPAEPAVTPSPTLSSMRYSPLGTLRPTFWSPEIVWDSDQLRLGAATFGQDVLGYHSYSATATWLASSPGGAPTPSGGVPDWFVSYAYDRWWPTLFGAASMETSFFAGPPTDLGTPSAATRRERQLQAGIVMRFLSARTAHTVTAALFRSVDEYTLVDRTFDRERSALRTAWRTNTAKTFGYSISPEHGVTLGATAELVRRGLGASADATTVTGDARAYLPGAGRHHVVAVRAAAGASSGDSIVGRTFLLGGVGPDASVMDFGSDAISVLRGFRADTFAGTRVALINAEYRAPLVRPQRGYGTWPFFVHTLYAAAFTDVGTTWTRSFDRDAIKSSIGAELSADLVGGFSIPFTVSTGVAWGHDGSGTIRSGALAYFRVGKSF